MSGNLVQFVGFFVGKNRRPDNERVSVINALTHDCRVCRIFSTEESCQESPLTRLRVCRTYRSVFQMRQVIDPAGLE